MRIDPVFPKIDPLPRAQGQQAVRHWDRKIHRRERSPYVRGHVDVTLRRVNIPPVAIGRQPSEDHLEIHPDVGIGIFLDLEGCRRMAQMKNAETGMDRLLPDKFLHFASDLHQATPGGLEDHFALRLPNHMAKVHPRCRNGASREHGIIGLVFIRRTRELSARWSQQTKPD